MRAPGAGQFAKLLVFVRECFTIPLRLGCALCLLLSKIRKSLLLFLLLASFGGPFVLQMTLQLPKSLIFFFRFG